MSSYNYITADWVSIKAQLRTVEWKEILSNCYTSGDKIKKILEIVWNIVDKHTTKFKASSSRKNIPKDRRLLLRNKNKLKKKLTNSSYTDQEQVKNLITEIDKNLLASHLLERKKEETMAIENIKTYPKYFFTYAKKHLKTKGTIGPLRVNNKQITSNEEISQCLAEQYSSTFSIPNPNHDIGDTIEFFSYADDHTAYLLTDITFTKEMLIKEIGNKKGFSTRA